MRKTILALLTFFLFFGLALPAHAAGEIDADVTGEGQQKEPQVQEPQEPTQEEQQPEDQQEPQDSLVVVSTLEELQAAVDAAKDRDTVYIANTIPISDEIIEVEKRIAIMRLDGFYGAIFRLKGNTVISGFDFIDNGNSDTGNILMRIKVYQGLKSGRKTAQKSRECKYVANKSHKALLRCLRQ